MNGPQRALDAKNSKQQIWSLTIFLPIMTSLTTCTSLFCWGKNIQAAAYNGACAAYILLVL